MSQSKPREWWILEYSDKDRECFTEKETRGDKSVMVHVIEHSAYLEAIARAEAAEQALKHDVDKIEAQYCTQLAAVTKERDKLEEQIHQLILEAAEGPQWGDNE